MSEECTYVMNLPPAKQEEIRRALNEQTFLNGGRYRTLIEMMEGVIGRKVSETARFPVDVWARTMCAYQMIREGFNHSEIARQMGRDHSTITFFKHKMEDVFQFPNAFKDIIQVWEQFQKRIEQ